MANAVQAVVDIGTNSILLLIAERRPDGSIRVIRDEANVARLAEGVSETGYFRADAIERTCNLLRGYCAIAASYGAPVLAVATEGVRMAKNPEDFLQPAAAIVGRPIRLLSGDEEAQLSYLSVAAEHSAECALNVIDVGGGSSELVSGIGHRMVASMSHPLGSVRLTEQFVKDTSAPIDADVIAAMERYCAEQFQRQFMPQLNELHAVAGTATHSAALVKDMQVYDRASLDKVHVTRQALVDMRNALAAESLQERLSRHPTLGPGRADIIVAGVTVLCVAMKHCGADVMVVRDRGLRYALIK
eukprot:TRINITY_DN8617_c0_g1_i1.p1 TRINITY_DN8617_c0_g1~~TRINITY_DN8617_c0_g1_i1.p1  ORF type:complete len:302 (+),score=73.97 TRINITY_DN8617_c0_g1_i1:54-959(+)